MTKNLRQQVADRNAFHATLAAPRPNIYEDDIWLPCANCRVECLVNYDDLRDHQVRPFTCGNIHCTNGVK